MDVHVGTRSLSCTVYGDASTCTHAYLSKARTFPLLCLTAWLLTVLLLCGIVAVRWAGRESMP